MNGLNPYRLTILGAIVVLVLSVGVMSVIGTANASQYIAFLTPTVVGLMALLRVEQNAKENKERHAENVSRLVQTEEKIDNIRVDCELNVEEAALKAASIINANTPTRSA